MATVEVSFSLLNLLLEDEVRLSANLLLRPLPTDRVTEKYLGHSLAVGGIPDWTSAQWRPSHNVEAVYSLPADTNTSTAAFADRTLHQLMSAITLSRVVGTRVYASHMVSPSESRLLRSFGDVTFNPKPLRPVQVEILKEAFAIAGGCLADDTVLAPALDRFTKARHESIHGRRINVPNWDKLAEYVVCMETLFLSQHKGRRNRESVSYRFALNGTSLLFLAGHREREMTFAALKRLYGIRSTIVHGESAIKISQEVDKFLSDLAVKMGTANPATRLQHASQRAEMWLYAVFGLLANMPEPERPFARKRGWEHLLWR